MRVINQSATPIGHEVLTISSEVKALTSSIYLNAITASITVENASIRFWIDKSSPSATEGILLGANASLDLDSSAEIAGFRAIATSTDAKIMVIYSV